MISPQDTLSCSLSENVQGRFSSEDQFGYGEPQFQVSNPNIMIQQGMNRTRQRFVNKKDCVVEAQYLQGSLLLITVRVRNHTNHGFSKQVEDALSQRKSEFWISEFHAMHPVHMTCSPNSDAFAMNMDILKPDMSNQGDTFPQIGYLVILQDGHVLHQTENLRSYLEKFSQFLGSHQYNATKGVFLKTNWTQYEPAAQYDITSNPKQKVGNVVVIQDCRRIIRMMYSETTLSRANPNINNLLEQYFDDVHSNQIRTEFQIY